MDILSTSEKQVILYSKGHFKRTEMMEDLKILTAEAFTIPVRSTEIYHIYHYVLKIFIKLQEHSYVANPHDFLNSLFTWKNPTLDVVGMIEEMLSHFSNTESNNLNLGDPDYSILPKKETKKLKHG